MKALSEKFTVYKTLYTLNQGLEIVLLTCNRLEQLGVFGQDQLRSCRIMTEELRARVNFGVTEALHFREDNDWTRMQNLRIEWETKLRVQGENMPRPETPKPQSRPAKKARKSAPTKKA